MRSWTKLSITGALDPTAPHLARHTLCRSEYGNTSGISCCFSRCTQRYFFYSKASVSSTVQVRCPGDRQPARSRQIAVSPRQHRICSMTPCRSGASACAPCKMCLAHCDVSESCQAALPHEHFAASTSMQQLQLTQGGTATGLTT